MTLATQAFGLDTYNLGTYMPGVGIVGQTTSFVVRPNKIAGKTHLHIGLPTTKTQALRFTLENERGETLAPPQPTTTGLSGWNLKLVVGGQTVTLFATPDDKYRHKRVTLSFTEHEIKLDMVAT